MENIKSDLIFQEYTVNLVEFKRNTTFEKKSVKVDFSIAENTQIKENQMTVDLYVDIFKDSVEKQCPFKMKINLTGFFEITNSSKDAVEKYKSNAIAILYPYVRALVSNYTAASNIPPLFLPIINVNKFIEQETTKNSN